MIGLESTFLFYQVKPANSKFQPVKMTSSIKTRRQCCAQPYLVQYRTYRKVKRIFQPNRRIHHNTKESTSS